LGDLGERIAVWYLTDKGMRVLAGNVEVPGGELDILARDGHARVVVEVRTIRGEADPIDAVNEAKRIQVARLARRAGATRVDLLGIRLDQDGCDLHWVPDAV
jgi:putative endonuclease